jgi:DnaK suppressor protein
VKTEEYKRALLQKERELTAKIERAHEGARERGDESVQDVGDESVIDESRDVQFSEAELDRVVLNQVRDALKRIEDGTFGRCVVDGGPIEEKRLKEVPWTPYCLKHQQELEQAKPRRMPTL